MGGFLVAGGLPAAGGSRVGPDRPRVLWCADCRRAVPCRPEDAARYAEAGWPRCCGEVMSLSDGWALPGPGRAAGR